MMSTVKINFVLFLTLLFWASAFVGIRMGLVGYSPGSLALLRFLVASLCLVILNRRVRNKVTIPWKDRIHIAFLGMIGIGIYHYCLNFGEINVSAGIASFVIGLMPVITVLLSFFILKEKLSTKLWFGVFISFLGLLLIIVGDGSKLGLDIGIISILIAAIAGSILNIFQKDFLHHYHPVEVTAWILWGGTLSLMIFSVQLFHEIQLASWETTVAVVYLGIFPAAISQVGWGYVLNYMTVSRASISLYALPIISTLLGYFILSETPTILSFIGGLIALVGALIAGISKNKDC
jgi:drug/metabolite transporter (DMT)-like permease